VTIATEKAWEQFSTPAFGCPTTSTGGKNEKVKPRQVDSELLENLKKTHVQMVVDSASVELLSGRQMSEVVCE
jgi:hypothetical protein